MPKPIEFNLPIKILGHGRALPSNIVSNIELLKRTPIFSGRPESYLEKVEERMIQGFGFKHRHLIKWPTDPLINGPESVESSESLGYDSAKIAIAGQTHLPEILIHGTTTSSRYTGSQATAIAGRLGLAIPAFETKAGCSTGLATLHLTYSLMLAGHDYALCVFAETLSKVIDPENSEAWFGLADGAASVFIKKSTTLDCDALVLKSLYFTDGEHIGLYSTQGQLPPTQSDLDKGGYYLKGDPEAMRLQAIRRYKDLLDTLLTATEKEQIRWIFCHQVNRQIIRDVIEQNNLAGEPIWINHEVGNIGGTTIPFSISIAKERNLLKKGDLILLMSVGGGISAAAQLWRWNCGAGIEI